MVNDDGKLFERASFEEQFLTELCRRTSKLPFNAESGNELIAIDTKGCSTDFMRKVESFIESPGFKLLIRGSDYFLELLDGNTYQNLFKRSAGDGARHRRAL